MTHYLSMLVFGKLRVHVTLHKQEYRSNFLYFVSASCVSQLSNYANANYLRISIWTWLMSYHVKTTLCHDITTYDISWKPYSASNNHVLSEGHTFLPAVLLAG